MSHPYAQPLVGDQMGRVRRHVKHAIVLYVEYVERRTRYGILFIFSLFCEYINLEYVRIHVIYRVHQAEYAILIPMAAPQEYVNTYSTRRVIVPPLLLLAKQVIYIHIDIDKYIFIAVYIYMHRKQDI